MKTHGTLYDYTPENAPPHWLLKEEGQAVALSGNQPILLDDPASAWVIFAGRVDVFVVRLCDGQVAGTRRRLFRCDTGQVLFGMAFQHDEQYSASPEVGLLVSSVPGTTLLKIPRTRLIQLARDPARGTDVVHFLDTWINELSASIGELLPPQTYQPLQAGQELALLPQQCAYPPRGVVWVKHLSGSSQFLGCQAWVSSADNLTPVSRFTWLQAFEPSTVLAVDTAAFVAQDPAWAGLDRFHQLALTCIRAAIQQHDQVESERLKQRALADRQVMQNAISRLAAAVETGQAASLPTSDEQDALLTACRWVGNAMGIAVRGVTTHGRASHDSTPHGDTPHATLQDIARASNFRLREVMLRENWWQQDNGPLLAYLEKDAVNSTAGAKRPVALLPVSPTWYELHDPLKRTRVRVTSQIAAMLHVRAYTFYRPLPTRPLVAWDLLRFGLWGGGGDLRMTLLMALAVGLLGLVVPLAIGFVFNDAIPMSDHGLLTEIFGALAASALASAVFQFVQNMAILRLQARSAASIQAATWDRLLSLPAPFFRQYTAGDLGARAMGLDRVHRALTQTMITVLLSSIFSLFNVILLFVYAPQTAWGAIGLIALALAISALFGYLQTDRQRKMAHWRGQISGIVLQLIGGIAKLRVAGAENRAFDFWVKKFSAQKRLDYQARTAENNLTVFNSAYPLLNMIVLFALIALAGKSVTRLSAGHFVAFYAAFGQLLTASLQVCAALLSTWDMFPTYERARPILRAMPEVDEARLDPGELTGEIEVDHIQFRYQKDGPLVLNDVSMHIESGEFVALVGTSGSGKSTMFRILLGFETPESGAVFYSGQDLSKLDLRAVRRQIGVVLQNGKLVSGSILDNIIGVSSGNEARRLTVEDAWEAARLVGLAHDIERMPMGMYTVISHGGSTLSGGQRQRILIARAIVHKPRILFFDEATSALDNTTQAIVSRSMERLQATRIVIAHRLSTIVHADRIFVFDKGRIAQAGTFDELVKQTGLFANLARRQLI